MDEQPSGPDMLPLPGLDDPTQSAQHLELAVRRTLDAINTAGLITARDAGMMQLCLELSRAVTAGVRSGRASAVAMAARELRETLLALPQPEAAPAGDEWRDLVQRMVDAGDGTQ